MRTTLTLDDDVAALLRRAMKARKTSLKIVVNEALRRGLEAPAAAEGRHRPYRTPGVSLGRCLVGDIDDVAEVLAMAEDERLR